MKRKLPPNDILISLLETHSQREIAKMYGVSSSNVSVLLKKLGIRRKTLKYIDDESLKEAYLKTYSLRDTAKLLRVSSISNLSVRLRKMGFDLSLKRKKELLIKLTNENSGKSS